MVLRVYIINKYIILYQYIYITYITYTSSFNCWPQLPCQTVMSVQAFKSTAPFWTVGQCGWTGYGSGHTCQVKQGWVGGRFGVIKTQRPTHPPLERNSEDHIEECCDPKCYISKQTHHDDLMSKLSCIVKLQLLATTAMPNCHVSASVQEHSSFWTVGQCGWTPPLIRMDQL